MDTNRPVNTVIHSLPTSQVAFDLCVFIGRFQPFHVAHQAVVSQALACAHRALVLVGSANEPRTLRNPFTAEERMGMIRYAMSQDERLWLAPLEDSTYDVDEWVERTRATVDQVWAQIRAQDPSAPVKPRVAIIGHIKDATSFYLKLFPQWFFVGVPQHEQLAATTLRADLLGSPTLARELIETQFPHEAVTAHADEKNVTLVLRRIANTTSMDFLNSYTAGARTAAKEFLRSHEAHARLPASVIEALMRFVDTEDYQTLAYEQAFVFKFHYAWRLVPYAPIFMTADAVVFRGNQVLMVKRGNYPGKGLWALPGGFLEQDETLETAAVRELAEETSLNTTEEQLHQALFGRDLFDAPFRSSRGRTVTMAHYFLLDASANGQTKEGGLEGDEETQAIAWRDIDTLRRDEVFEDHYSIIAKAKRCLANSNR